MEIIETSSVASHGAAKVVNASELGRPSFKVGLMGASLGTGNRGVSALAASTIKLVTENAPEARVTLLIGHRTRQSFSLEIDGVLREIPVVNYRMSPKASLRDQLWWILLVAACHRCIPIAVVRRGLCRLSPWVKTVAEADLVADIRGGDSFSDIYGFPRFFFASLAVISVIWIRGEIALLPQTYGPFKGAIARGLARYILRRSSPILARDQASLQYVDELLSCSGAGQLSPDVAFALRAEPQADPSIAPPLPAERGVLVGLNVNGLMYHGGYTRANMFGLKLDYREFLEKLALSVLERPGHRLLLVPHTFAPPGSVESDPGACDELRKRLPESVRDRVHLVTRDYNQNEIKGVIGLCDFFIGSRMHSCIAALSQGIPTIGVAYSKKFAGVFESVGAGGWVIDGRDVGAGEAVDRAMKLLEARGTIREPLRDRVCSARDRLRDVFQRLVRGGAVGKG